MQSAGRYSRFKVATITVLTALLCHGPVRAQLRDNLGAADATLCGSIKTEPSLDSCFGCLLEMFGQCQQLGTPEERQLCNLAAMVVFIDCYSSIRGPAQPRAASLRAVPNSATIDVRSDFDLMVSSSEPFDPERLNVRLIHHAGDRYAMDTISHRAETVDTDGSEFVIRIDARALSIHDDDSVWIVIGTDPESAIGPAAANLIRLDVADSFDINRDGRFDATDRAAAVTAYNRGQIDLSTTSRILRTAH